MENKRTPEIRFAGFTEEWKECRLGEISERVRGNDGRMDLPTLTISAESGWLDQRERFSANIAGNEQMNYTLLSKGELSYNHGNSKLAKYGVVFELRNYEEALVPRVYHSFKTKGQAEENFIEYMFATKRPDRELAKLVSSGARMDGLLNISYDDFMGIKIKIPSLNEQKKIAKFLRQLDKTIALHQQELTTLKQTKQGFLQKMFPKEGEPVPEIRFPEFTGGWGESKISEIGYISAGGDIDKSKLIDGGEFPVLANAITNDGIVGYYNEYKSVAPAVTITGRGDVGHAKARHVNFTAIVRLLVLKPFDNFNVDFLELAINNTNILVESTGVPQLTAPQLGNYKISFPTLEEQNKVGNFFKQIDDTIALHQRELDALKETKKAFLQKMFV
ncbi:restriction endonuclease subunit S [Paenibacillus apiarius]|uniref:Restriction endonuclease subunit S n=1 Tax=Paenibacillus apiarius TaxID=46240 RepID=A0ABT4DZ33_9BACL|nr:restriction endonuclease subunit S [Paenibacillus apiarius]MCY9514052.1 restriction endonuclease subunit S [Paenibacillus apiarius]MCY9522609.1 restriction endonuclease subunit S [Paenibacillus apiarius]MCY9553034.1 restriction endonuclease subunit S [Paenibacillus apiarius]MCY9556325.1 restriction endonuclease subunit S [Paenibacillus apiarius]MCY9686490.1 restriction endonuclease subunit S [Paenibacillus apiarius]